jgi:hypothetical protein
MRMGFSWTEIMHLTPDQQASFLELGSSGATPTTAGTLRFDTMGDYQTWLSQRSSALAGPS